MSLPRRWHQVRRRLGRVLRQARSSLRQPAATLVYHLEYSMPENPLMDARRSERILNYLRREGCLSPQQLRRPWRIGLEQFARVHEYEYLEQVGEPAVLERIFGVDVHRLDRDRLVNAQRRMVAGTVAAAGMAVKPWRRGRPVINLGGGLHHAKADGGGGFCIFNDVAIAIRRLRADGYGEPILVVDLDLHQGDGTREIFADDPTVYTFSIHATDWDTAPATADLSIALGSGVSDRGYLEALDPSLEQAMRESGPGLVFYLAGVDVAVDDRLGSWRLSSDAILARDRRVIEAIGDRGCVWLLAGGYGPDAWRHSARSLAWLMCGHDAPIPSSRERDLSHFRRIARRFRRSDLSGSEEEPILRVEDLMADLQGQGQSGKLMGFYSLYGIELAFERYGALPKIRSQGYPQVRFDLDTRHSTGERLRIFSADDRRDLLMEVVLRDSSELPPFRMLAVEWLLLQNPRATPGPDRPLLPGQQHPGLGILSEVVGMLVMVCERLGFDGLLFSPAHYHVASQAHGLLRFLEPGDEAYFAAIEEALSSVPLAQATRLVHGGDLVDEATGELVYWRPAPMVFPVSERLKAHFEDEDYDRKVSDAASRLRFRRRARGKETSSGDQSPDQRELSRSA